MKISSKVLVVIGIAIGSLLCCGGCGSSDCNPPQGEACLKKLGDKAGVVIDGQFDPATGFLCDLPNNFSHKLAGCDFSICDLRGVSINGVKRLQLSIVNKQNNNINIQYRVSWFDQHGMEIDPNKSNWKSLELYSRETKSLTAVSPNDQAMSFKVFVRDIKYLKFFP